MAPRAPRNAGQNLVTVRWSIWRIRKSPVCLTRVRLGQPPRQVGSREKLREEFLDTVIARMKQLDWSLFLGWAAAFKVLATFARWRVFGSDANVAAHLANASGIMTRDDVIRVVQGRLTKNLTIRIREWPTIVGRCLKEMVRDPVEEERAIAALAGVESIPPFDATLRLLASVAPLRAVKLFETV